MLSIIILQESSMNVITDVRMQRGFRVKRCSILKLWDLTGNSLLKCKTMPYCNTMRQTQSIIATLSCSVEVSRIGTTSVLAAAEARLEHEWDAVRSSFCESFGQVALFIFGLTFSCDGNKEWFVAYLGITKSTREILGNKFLTPTKQFCVLHRKTSVQLKKQSF